MGEVSLIGVLPVSALNIGVVAGIPVINAKIQQLTIEIGRLIEGLSAQLEVSLNIPQLPQLTLSLASYLGSVLDNFDPNKIFTASADLQTDLAADLALITLTLELVGAVNANFQAGLDVGSLSLWTYSGRAASFGERLREDTQLGFAGVNPGENINALIIATESFQSWGSFSATFNTSTSSTREVDPTTEANLQFERTLRGSQLNTGVLDLSQPIELFLLELEALKINLEFSLGLALGINIPEIPPLDVDLDLSEILFNLINVSVDLNAQIELLNLQIDFLAELLAELELSLSAGGLAFWVYTGSASELGSSFETAIAEGVPGGTGPDVASYGVVVATKVPSAWASFGLIFATG